MLALALTLAAALPAIGLNHFYIVLDRDSFDAIAASAFVTGELAEVDGGLKSPLKPHPGSASLYLRGRDTYIELLAPNNHSGEPVGACGLAFSPNDAGDLDKLEAALRRAGQPAHQRVVLLDAGEHPIPWYNVVAADAQDGTRLQWWLSQYHPDFVRQVLHTDRVDRKSFLAHLYRPELLLEDVVTVTLALTTPESAQLRAQLHALGFREKRAAGGLLLEGSGFEIRIVTQAQARGPTIVAATLGLSRPLTRSLTLGATRLDAEGQRAVWHFAPAPAQGKTARNPEIRPGASPPSE